MRQKVVVVFFVCGLLMYVVTGIQVVSAPYTEDGSPFILASPINITSPANSTSSSGALILNVTFKLLLNVNNAKLVYSIDGKDNVTIPLQETPQYVEVTITYENGTTVIANSSPFLPDIITGCVELPELTEGSHNITVYARYIANTIIGLDKSTVYFTIRSEPKQELPEFPTLTILPLVIVAIFVATILGKRLLVCEKRVEG
ncbi:MAG: hypothetical protein NWF06_10285 [Candidatus Bathyarchaeota archaeon]|nr:hypothetical protein [Candidatus Bathyarchaeum sp.]